MNRREFIEYYCYLSCLTVEEFNKTQIALPCECGAPVCCGWAAVSKNEQSVNAHNKLYNNLTIINGEE